MTSSQQNKQAPAVVASLENRSAESFSKNQSPEDSSHQILPDSRGRFQNPNSESTRNQIQIPEQSTRPLYPPNNYKARSEVAGQEPEIVVKKVVSKAPANQCIDLIILSDSDEELECNHLTIR